MTASVPSTAVATPEIFLPPASMPPVVTLGPFVIVRPVSDTDVFCVSLPIVKPPDELTLNLPPAALMMPAALMSPSEFTVNLSPEILNAPLLETESLPSIVVVYPSVASPLRVIPFIPDVAVFS